MSQFLPADFDKGDPNTLGGYMAVHARPAAFEGSNGASYSVEMVVDEHASAGLAAQRFSGYLLFVEWRRTDPVAAGHLETDYLGHGTNPTEVRNILGALPLQAVRLLMEDLINERAQDTGS